MRLFKTIVTTDEEQAKQIDTILEALRALGADVEGQDSRWTRDHEWEKDDETEEVP